MIALTWLSNSLIDKSGPSVLLSFCIIFVTSSFVKFIVHFLFSAAGPIVSVTGQMLPAACVNMLIF